MLEVRLEKFRFFWVADTSAPSITAAGKKSGRRFGEPTHFLPSIAKVSRAARWRCRTTLLAFLLLMHGAGTAICDSSGPNDFTGPKTAFHLAANGNFGARSQYLPGKAGFNLADVNSVAQLNSLPPGVKGLVWVGQCSGVDAKFIATVKPYIGNPKLFGYYLMDDPDPRSIAYYGMRKNYCPPSNLKAQSEWIHGHVPGAKTFILPMNMGSRQSPTYENTYNPASSGVDLYGIDPYPCHPIR